MCGIWCSIGFQPDPMRIDLVSHRGPDGRGWQVFDTVAGPLVMGHRRLSIIDLSNAALQPMQYADGRYWLVFNGEIYNYLELRKTLEASGYFFHTQSDSEVLLAAYARWGEAALARFIGMFAFVIWDRDRESLFIARDRFGIKPLYYFAHQGSVAFASEIKQVIGLPGDRRRMNLARVHDFVASGIMEHTDETLFEGIKQLRAGECLMLSLRELDGSNALCIRRWYRPPPPGSIELDEREASDRFRTALSESVRLHLRSDVPVGSCLSGGLDSSAIVCLMADQLRLGGNGATVNCVTACYDEKQVDERPFVEAVVAATSSRPHYIYPRVEDVFARAEQITWHQDEPYGSTSIFAQWCVFDAAHKAGIKVMLDGQGADEQLAGYHSCFSYYVLSLIRQKQWLMLARTMLERRLWHGVSLQDQFHSFIAPLLPAKLAAAVRREIKLPPSHGWLDSEVFRGIDTSRGAFDTALARSGLGPVRDIGDICIALTAWNVTCLLHWEDRNSMAHSVEARVPFLDHRLVDLSIGLGSRHKIVGGDTKRVLRRGMKGILPEKIRKRRDKLGFATPEELWFRGSLRPAIEAGVDETLNRYPGLLNPAGTRALVADYLDGRRPMDFTVWRIVNLGIWGRKFALSV
jgi:asparagine synthase (glutamine-hydrolysing)